MSVALKRNSSPSFETSRRKFTIIGATLGSKIDSISYLLDEAISYTSATLNNHFGSESSFPIDLRNNDARSHLPKLLPTDSDSEISSKLRISLAILINRSNLVISISNFFTSIYSTPVRVFDLDSQGKLDKARSVCGVDDLSVYAASSAIKISEFASDSKDALNGISWDLFDLFSTLLAINQMRQRRFSDEKHSDLAS